MSKISKKLKFTLKIFLFSLIFALSFFPPKVSAETTLNPEVEALIEELLNETPAPESPLGVAENNQKIREQKAKNETITLVSLILIIISGTVLVILIFLPFIHHRKKKPPIKF